MKHIGTQLKRHIKSVHKHIRYSCDKCDKSFDRQDVLQRHVKSEHEKNQYFCDKCDKSFNDQDNLQRHVKSEQVLSGAHRSQDHHSGSSPHHRPWHQGRVPNLRQQGCCSWLQETVAR